MKLGKTSDSSGRAYVYEISNEIEIVFKQLEEKYKEVNLEIFTAFRCLPERLERKTFRRYDKKDNVLYLDIVLSEDKFAGMTKEEQRFYLSHAFYDYISETLTKYQFPGLDVTTFLQDLVAYCKQIGWLKEEWEVYI